MCRGVGSGRRQTSGAGHNNRLKIHPTFVFSVSFLMGANYLRWPQVPFGFPFELDRRDPSTHLLIETASCVTRVPLEWAPALERETEINTQCISPRVFSSTEFKSTFGSHGTHGARASFGGHSTGRIAQGGCWKLDAQEPFRSQKRPTYLPSGRSQTGVSAVGV